MKLKDTFITHWSGDRQVMVSVDTSSFPGFVRSNSTAAYIIDCLKKDTTEDAIVSKMQEEYDAPEEMLRRDVRKVISTLREIGALDEQQL